MKKGTFLTICFTIVTLILNAQVSNYTFSSTVGTYTPLTGGDSIVKKTCAFSYENLNVKNVAIGFTFKFNGVDYTTLGVNTNGFIWFGSGSPKVNSFTPISTDLNLGGTGTIDGIVAPMGKYIYMRFSAPCGNIVMATAGTAGSQTCTIQYAGFRNGVSGTGNAEYNFQVILHEGTNKIDFVYGTLAASTKSVPAQVGLRGATNADFNNRTTLTDWTATVAGTKNDTTMEMSATVNPASGLTFTWTPGVSTTGITNTTEAMDAFNIYPNPTSGKFTIGVPNSLKVASMEIYNALGEKVATVQNATEVDLSKEPKGVYFARIAYGNKTAIKKIVVQ